MFYPEFIHLQATEETLPRYQVLAELSLDRADEARRLMAAWSEA